MKASPTLPAGQITLTASLPRPLDGIVRSLRSGTQLIVLTGDVQEVFTQNYRYQSVLDWLKSTVPSLTVQYVTDHPTETVRQVFKESKPIAFLNAELLFADRPASMVALIQSQLRATPGRQVIMAFSLPSSIPNELFAPSLDAVFLPIRRMGNDDPKQLLSYFLSERDVTAALDEVKPALRGLSNQDILYALNRIITSGNPITYQSVLDQKVNLLRARYSRLGAVQLSPSALGDLPIAPTVQRVLQELVRAGRGNADHRTRLVAFYGVDVSPVMEAFARDLGLVSLRIGNLVQDTLSETRSLLDQLEDLIFTQPGCAVLVVPYELVVPIDAGHQSSPPQVLLAHKRFTEILSRMARHPDAGSLFIGTPDPGRLGLEINLKFATRIPVLPFDSLAAGWDALTRLATRRGLDVSGLPEPPAEIGMVTALHLDCLLDEVAARTAAGDPLSADLWRVLPPTDDLDVMRQQMIRWSNVRL